MRSGLVRFSFDLNNIDGKTFLSFLFRSFDKNLVDFGALTLLWRSVTTLN